MHPPIAILDATPDDAGELFTVLRAAFLSEAILYERFDLPVFHETVQDLEGAIKSMTVLKAQAGTRIVGTVRAQMDGPTCQISRLAVAPDRQGEGIGSRLIDEVERRFAGRATRFQLDTGPRSERNVRLYQRLGYEVIPVPPGGIPFLIYLAKSVGSAPRR